jgi:hypothetical protein
VVVGVENEVCRLIVSDCVVVVDESIALLVDVSISAVDEIPEETIVEDDVEVKVNGVVFVVVVSDVGVVAD